MPLPEGVFYRQNYIFYLLEADKYILAISL
jgi:hypothetical protein